MCGIVGYVGDSGGDAALLSALARPECRGEDSAGICLLRRGTLRGEELTALAYEVRTLPQRIAEGPARSGEIEAVAAELASRPFFLYLGRHAGLAICPAAGEMKHGPIALIDEGTPVVCVATPGRTAATLHSNLREVRARGARVVAFAVRGDDAVEEPADDLLLVPRAHPLVQPALAVLPLRVLAYHIARRRGLDVDRPRNLAKTVTVE
jgi:glucosamine--fructose-6-phosphate aminotransferase (isomerizing)